MYAVQVRVIIMSGHVTPSFPFLPVDGEHIFSSFEERPEKVDLVLIIDQML